MKVTLIVFLSVFGALAEEPAPPAPPPPAPAPASRAFPTAEVVNKGLPKWLSFSGELRARVEGFEGASFSPNRDDAYLLTRVRLNVKIAPTPWLKFFGQAQDARVFWKNQNPAVPPFQNTMDIRQAYAEIGNLEKDHFAIKAGRQEFVYGDQRLIGHVSWLNTARSFDAIRASIAYGKYKLDAFASSVVAIKDGEMDHHVQGDNFHGLYGSAQDLVPKSVIEPYVLWRVTSRGKRAELTGVGNMSFYTGGGRWAGKLPSDFDYNIEMAVQRGFIVSDSISAWAGHWQMGYTAVALHFKPRFIGEFNYASGDKNAKDGTISTFDQLYPTPHDKYGLADQVGWKNIKDLRIGSEFKATKKLLLSPNYHNWWLANGNDALYAASSAVLARSATGTAGTHVGQELDLQAAYPLNKQVSVSGGIAHIFPGAFLKATTPGKSYTYPFFMIGYTF